MRHKIAIEMIQEVVQRKDDDNDEKTFEEGDEDEGEVVVKPDAEMSASDFLRDRKRRGQGDRTKRNSPKRGR